MNDPKSQPMFERCSDLEDKPDGPDRLSAIEASEIAGKSARCTLATGSLWVDAGEIMKLVRRYEREVELCNASADEAHKLKLAVACAADGARANALAQASFDLRLLVGGSTLRQPTENHTICHTQK